MTSDKARDYFEFIADLGHTKHYGSMQATRELVELCRIDEGAYVLDVGCGVGATPCYLAKEVGCRVMGVDFVNKMIEQSRQRAKAFMVEDLVEFKLADARQLPFEDNLFDVVIMESVNIFFEDKGLAMSEYVRVTKPGGYVGMTELTWLRPPSSKVENAFKEVEARALDADGWKALLRSAGLVDIAGGGRQMDLRQETQGRFERYGRWPLFKVIFKMLGKLITDPQTRRYVSGGVGAVSKDMLDVVGYGVYVGKKV
jgi:ubiquinone/menaquinone biosynthesis C-methylase UbiE